jgi:hypothetical protein
MDRLLRAAADPGSLLPTLSSSASLCTVLRLYLRNDSLLDVGKRADCYRCLLSFLSAVASDPFTTPMLAHQLNDDDDAADTISLLEALGKQAALFLTLHQSSAAIAVHANTQQRQRFVPRGYGHSALGTSFVTEQ